MMSKMPDIDRIQNTLGKFEYYLATHERIAISVSGGSDSDIIVHIVATYLRDYLPKIHFLFVNTGLEYKATLRHLEYIEEKYGIKIEKLRGMSVVNSVHKYGVPVLSKRFSHIVSGMQKGKEWAFKQANTCSKFGIKSEKERKMAYYLTNEMIIVSKKCCDVSKKKPLFQKQKELGCDMILTGERRAEGGLRAFAHTDCFEENNHGRDKYMPLFFWDDETKKYYKEQEKIVYSDCYEVWGMKRTGCVGCPFNSRVGVDLDLLRKYEPQMYKACLNVFGKSYEVMDMFGIHRKPILSGQIGLEEG